MIRRVSSVLIAAGLMASCVQAQALNPPAQKNTTTDPFATASPAQAPAAATPAPSPSANQAGAQRSIVRHNPLPHRSAYNSYDRGYSSGAATGYSTGGAGRFAEYYDPNTLAVEHPPARVGSFEQGGGPGRSEQIAAQQAGTARATQIQNSIDTYGRPIGSYGFGYGLGLGFGGRLYNYPY